MTPKAPGALCDQCPARDAPFVPSESPPGRVRLAIVGEAPGRNEVEQKRPFVGASGRMMQRGLQHHRLQRGEAHWTNAVLCAAAKDDLPGAMKCCAPRLAAELDQLVAGGVRVILTLGAWGLSGTLGRRVPIMKYRGSVITRGVAWVLPTLHPAFIMRGAEKWAPTLERDVARAMRIVREGWRDPMSTWSVASTPEAVSRIGEALGDDPAFDVETVGLGPTRTALVCFVLSDGANTTVIPWSKTLDGLRPWWSDPDDIARRVSEIFRPRVIVTQNGPAFDHIIAERYGLEIDRWADTLLGYHVLYGHLPKNLAQIATHYLDVPPWKQWEHAKSLEQMWEYNARDGCYTALAWHEMKGELFT